MIVQVVPTTLHSAPSTMVEGARVRQYIYQYNLDTVLKISMIFINNVMLKRMF